MNLKKIRDKRYIAIFLIIFALIIFIISLKADFIFEQGKFTKLSLFDKFFGKEIPLDAIEIVLPKDKYKVGEEIYFGIQNKTNKTIKVENECPEEPLDIYYWKDNEWEHVKAGADLVCKSGAGDVVIYPYELRAASFMPWQKILFRLPGKYKIRLEVISSKTKFEKEFEVVE